MKGSKLMIVATLAWTAWAVWTAMGLDGRVPRVSLAILSAAVPLGLLLSAAYVRSSVRTNRLMAWSLGAAMLMVGVVDFVAWSLDR